MVTAKASGRAGAGAACGVDSARIFKYDVAVIEVSSVSEMRDQIADDARKAKISGEAKAAEKGKHSHYPMFFARRPILSMRIARLHL